MAEPCNLTPDDWADILVKKASADSIGGALEKGNYLPWCTNLLQLTQDSKEILDLGSGAGENSGILGLNGKKPIMLDWSKDNLLFDKELFGKLKKEGGFCRADMTKPLPFKNNSIDAVFSCGVFEYFSDEEIKAILKEAFRVARKRVIIMVPNALSVPYRIGKWYMEKTKKWHWGGERPFRTLKSYFRALGHENILEFTVGVKHSLDFLTMPRGNIIKSILIRVLRLKNHSKPAWFGQGYLLIAVAEKKGT